MLPHLQACFSCAMCLILIITGIVGCSFKTPENYVGGESVLTSIVVYYSTLAAYLLVYAVYNHIHVRVVSIVLFLFRSLVALISAYGLYQAASRWSAKIENVVEILLYLSVVYLVGKTPPFDELGRKVVTDFTALPVVASAVIVLFTAFVIIRVKQIKAPFYFDRFEILRVTYAITALVGLCCFGNGVAFVACTVITALDIYALSTLVKSAKGML